MRAAIAAALLLSLPAWAQDARVDGYNLRSMVPVPAGALDNFRAQFRLIDAADVSSCTLTTLRNIRIHYTPGRTEFAVGAAGVLWGDGELVRDQPVLLHAMLRYFSHHYIHDGEDNPQLHAAIRRARAYRPWRKAHAIFDQPDWFFAASAIVLRYDGMPGAPFTRAEMRRVLPKYVRWLDQQLGHPGKPCTEQ